MTEERLKEIKDSIEFQAIYIKEHNFETVLLEEETDLYNEVIDLKEENKRLKKELNKHIKEGIEKDQEIERLNKGLEYAKRVEKDYKTKFDKAIKCIKSKFVEQGGFTSYEWNDLLRELLNILQGSDKE